jgi:hypothetical protein
MAESETPKKPSTVVMSKKKYQEIKAKIEQYTDEETLEKILRDMCEVMRFEPNEKIYTPERGKKFMEWRKKHAEKLGITDNEYRKGFKTKIACTNTLCEEAGYEKYKGMCLRCFVHIFPNETVVKHFKTKESSVVAYIKDQFPEKSFTLDKKIEGGCSRYRPDMMLDCLTHSIIVEVDENQHERYDCTCENKRLMALFEDLGNRPLVMIRFNPDDYVDINENIIESCFVYKNKNGLPSIKNKYKWDKRLNALKETIKRHVDNIPDKEVIMEHLYYDGFV